MPFSSEIAFIWILALLKRYFCHNSTLQVSRQTVLCIYSLQKYAVNKDGSLYIIIRDNSARLRKVDSRDHYSVRVHDADDYFFNGNINLKESLSTDIHIKTGELSAVNIELKYINNIIDCNAESNQLLTKCVNENLDKKFPTCSERDLIRFNCSDPYEAVKRLSTLSQMKLNGYQQLQNKTDGCKLPCLRKVYTLREAIRTNTKVALFNAPLDSAIIIVRKFQNEFVDEHQEEYVYGVTSFISDVGGAFGLFLGLSFWAIFDHIRKPVENLLPY